MSNPEADNPEKKIIVDDRLQMAKNRWKKAKIEKGDSTVDKSENQSRASEGGDFKYVKGFSRPGTASKASFSHKVSSNKRQNWMKQEPVESVTEDKKTLDYTASVEDVNKSEIEPTLRPVSNQESVVHKLDSPDSESSSSDSAAEEASISNIPTNDDLNMISSKIFRAELMGDTVSFRCLIVTSGSLDSVNIFM